MKEQRKKLKSRSGFTLGEMLVAVLILLMVSAVVAQGVPSAANVYRRTIDAANAQVLLSTTVNALRDELTTARGVTVTDNKVSYYSADTGARTQILVNDRGEILVQDYMDYTGAMETSHPLVSNAAATKNLQISYSSVSETNGLVCFKDLTVRNINTDAEVVSLASLRIHVLGEGLDVPDLTAGSGEGGDP